MTLIDTIYLSICGAIIMLSLGNRRGIAWVLAIATSYFLSGFYWRSGLGQGELIAGLSDALVCLLIVMFGAFLWELWLGLVILACMAVNIAFLANNLLHAGTFPHEVYAITLEILNLCALLLIGGVSAFMQKGSTSGVAFHPWLHIFGFARPFGRTHR